MEKKGKALAFIEQEIPCDSEGDTEGEGKEKEFEKEKFEKIISFSDRNNNAYKREEYSLYSHFLIYSGHIDNFSPPPDFIN